MHHGAHRGHREKRRGREKSRNEEKGPGHIAMVRMQMRCLFYPNLLSVVSVVNPFLLPLSAFSALSVFSVVQAVSVSLPLCVLRGKKE
jgi:hypothetical protein